MTRYRSSSTEAGCLFILIWLAVAGLTIGTWLTHVVHCFQNGEWGFLIAGALMFPIANIHGFGLWFGWW